MHILVIICIAGSSSTVQIFSLMQFSSHTYSTCNPLCLSHIFRHLGHPPSTWFSFNPSSNLTTSCSFEPTPIPVTTAYFCPTLTTLSFNLTTSCSSEPSFPKPRPVSTSYTCPTFTTSCSFEPSFPTPIPVTTSYFCPTLTTKSSNLTTSCGSEPFFEFMPYDDPFFTS